MAHAAGFSFLGNCINKFANLLFSTMQVPGTEFLLVFAIEFQSCVRGSLSVALGCLGHADAQTEPQTELDFVAVIQNKEKCTTSWP